VSSYSVGKIFVIFYSKK